MEEFPSARAQDRKDVLEVGRGARRGAKCRRIEQASPRGKKEDARETAADLEPTRAEVLVREAVARDVERRPKKECREPRAAGGASSSTCRHVEGNYHGRRPRGSDAEVLAIRPASGVPQHSEDDWALRIARLECNDHLVSMLRIQEAAVRLPQHRGPHAPLFRHRGDLNSHAPTIERVRGVDHEGPVDTWERLALAHVFIMPSRRRVVSGRPSLAQADDAGESTGG
jgi:hypothetical protein